MVVRRFTGFHAHTDGQPSEFRSASGAMFPAGAGEVESLFSRKDETANLEGVRQQHAQAVKGFDVRSNSSIHITNNSAYIFRLNNGWSSQTPGGFFERAIPAAIKEIKGVWRLKEIP